MSQPLATRELVRRFKAPGGDVPVLRGASLALDEGEVVAVLGPSGSGKSTLLHLLGGLDRPDGGEIYWGDFAVHEHPPRELAARRAWHVGLIFQNHYLLPDFSLLENVMMPGRIVGQPDAKRAKELLERVGLGERLHFPPSRVSGGERQRAAVARALALGPRVLLADEPTGSLDHARAEAVFSLLLGLAAEEGTAVVAVTHDERLVDRPGVRTLRLVDGRLVPGVPRPATLV
ncbi:MAG: ABC transporter ATP-binding protein [Trueperaceae bacterium]